MSTLPSTKTVHTEHSTFPCDCEREAIATMWALAKSAKPEMARLWRGDHWETNAHLREAEVPEELRRQVRSILRHLDGAIVETHPIDRDDPVTFEEVIAMLPPGWRVQATQGRDLRGRPTKGARWEAWHDDYYQGKRPVFRASAHYLLAEVWTVERYWAEERV